MKRRGIIAKALFISLVMGSSVVHAGTAPAVPEKLQTPETEVVSLEARGTGVQIYECKAGKDDATRFEWIFQRPEAKLYDTAGRRIGQHYGGPTWESVDGSKVVGEIGAQDAGPDPNAIPWLLLHATSTSGKGVFSRTKSIQRLNTIGGKAPTGGCDQAHAGQQVRVPYQAMYFFYVEKP